MMKGMIPLMIAGVLLLHCQRDGDRKIKLSENGESGLGRSKEATIQVAAARKRSIAVLRLTNSTGDRSLNWLQNGIMEMIGTDLAQSRQFYLIPNTLIVPALQQAGWDEQHIPTPEDAQQVARQLRSFAFLIGYYYQNGDTLFVETELRRTEDATLLGSQKAAGHRLDNVFTMVDQLTRKLKNDLQLSLRQSDNNDTDREYKPTQSLEAYRAYLEGRALVDKFYAQQALPLFEKALALDSSFAAVYYPLANIYLGLNQRDRAQELIHKGLRHAEKASLRDRLNLQAMQAMINQDLTAAMTHYQQVCDLYPESADAFLNLGVYYFALGRYREAVENFEITIKLDSGHKMAYNMLGYSYAALYKVDMAKKALTKYAELAADEANPYDSLGDVLFRFGLINDAIDAYQHALKIDPSFSASAINQVSAQLALGEFDRAESLAKKILAGAIAPDVKVSAINALAQVYISERRLPEALETFQKILIISPDNRNALATLVRYDDDRIRREARLETWRRQIRTMTDQQLATNSDLIFGFVGLCLRYDYRLSGADSLLIWYANQSSNPFLGTIIGAFRQILLMAAGGNTFPGLYNSSDKEQRQVLANMPSIAWEPFWRYFFRTILRSGSDPAIIQQMVRAQRDLARSVGNLPFDMQFSSAVALLETLQGKSALAEEEYRMMGIPKEKDWQFSGPFPAQGGFLKDYTPEKKQDAEEGWFDAFDGIPDGYIDFTQIFSPEMNFTGYARLTVHSQKPQSALIRLGNNRPFKIWVNGELLLTYYEYTTARMDNSVYFTKLHAGSNQIMIKLNSLWGDAGFYLRLTDKKGYGLPDITFGEPALL